MDATEINGGRFYARPLHNDDRINDSFALGQVSLDFDVATAAQKWQQDETYTWAVCEQTNVEMVAFAILHVKAGVLDIVPVGDPTRVLPNDPDVEQKTVGDAVLEIREPIIRWCRAHDIALAS